MSENFRILRIKELVADSGLSRTTIWRKSRNPQDPFPALVQIGENACGARSDEYDAWKAGLPRVPWAPPEKSGEKAGTDDEG